jgi:cytochrome c553
MTARCMLALAVLGLVVGDSAAADREPTARPPVLTDRALVRYHMRRHFEDLKAVERLLVSGDLDNAKALAFMLSKPEADPGLKPWAAEAREVSYAAHGLAAARGLDEALRREPRIAAACADCHTRTGALLTFEPLRDPPDAGSRMARHQWAVDRLWEGMVAPSDERWRAGLDVLATTPVPPTAALDARALGVQLQALAASARDKRAKLSSRTRASLYGDMLVVCGRCHAGLQALPD